MARKVKTIVGTLGIAVALPDRVVGVSLVQWARALALLVRASEHVPPNLQKEIREVIRIGAGTMKEPRR